MNHVLVIKKLRIDNVGKKGNLWMVKLQLNKGGYVIQLEMQEGNDKFLFFSATKLGTAGNVGKKCNIWMVKLLMNKGV